MDCGSASICAHRRMRSRCKGYKRRPAELATARSQLWSGARRACARAAQHVAHWCSSDMGFEWADFDRALAGVIGGLAAGITKVDRERTDRHASTSAPGWTSQPLVRVSCLG